MDPINEAYANAISPIIEAKTKVPFNNLDKWESTKSEWNLSEKVLLKHIRGRISDMMGDVDKMTKEVGNALSPGFKMALGKDIKALAKSLHPMV